MTINWKVRLKNKTFWVTFIPAAVSFIYTVLAALGIVPRIGESEVINALLMAVSFLSALGILNDPTTSGLSDSVRAMNYTEPAKSEAEVISDDING